MRNMTRTGQILNGMHAGKATVFAWLVCLTAFLAAAFLIPGSASAGSSAPYDDFSTGTISSDKWRQYEFVREVTDGKLRLKARSSATYTQPVVAYMNVPYGTEIGSGIQADITPTGYENENGTRARAVLAVTLYNDTHEPDPYNLTGDVIAEVGIGYPARSTDTDPNQLKAYWMIIRFTNADGSESEILDSGVFDGLTPVLGSTYTASIALDEEQGDFVFGLKDKQATFPLPLQVIYNPSRELHGVYARISSNSGKEATIEALFDNVRVNGGSYDDFSASAIDKTKWTTYETVREVSSGKLRMKQRSSDNTSNSVYSVLGIFDPEMVNLIQAKVRLTAFNNENGAVADARLDGRFLHDSREDGGYSGDIYAGVALGGSLTTPKARWFIYKQNVDNLETVPYSLAGANFSKAITVGTDYVMSVAWDGSSFTFKIDDETVTQSIVNSGLPVFRPYKGFQTRILGNAAKEATIEALFDDMTTGFSGGGDQRLNPELGYLSGSDGCNCQREKWGYHYRHYYDG